jgi:hypothetical protein
VPRLKKEYSYISTPRLGLHGLSRDELYLSRGIFSQAYNCRGLNLTTHPNLVLRLRQWRYASAVPCFHDVHRDNLIVIPYFQQ